MSDKNEHGETQLQQLLKTLSPELNDSEYVFLSFKGAAYGEHTNLMPLASFNEKEGLTLVVPREQADKHEHSYQAVFKCITLQVHSSLEAVGLTAAFAEKLTSRNISANVIAGFYHDHIFVTSQDTNAAVMALNELSQA